MSHSLQYPILESAITGRIGVEDVIADNGDHRPSSLLDSAKMDDNELSKLRTAVMEREGLIVSIFELLRIIPRRLLMILKLSDLQRSVLSSHVFLVLISDPSTSAWQPLTAKAESS
jgi:aarF domain-containing kinase